MIGLVRFLLSILFRFRAYQTDALSTPGPVLMIPNHVSWLDWLFLGAVLETDWKFVVSEKVANTSWLHRRIMKSRRTFCIDTQSPYAVKAMAEFLSEGGRLVLFAEGRISSTGCLMKLFEGTGFLLYKTGARVITAYIRGANRLSFSRQPGWRSILYPVTVHFSDVLEIPKLPHTSTGDSRRRLSDWLLDQLMEHQFEVEMQMGPDNLLDAVIESADRWPHHKILEDVRQQPLTYRRLLTATRVFAKKLAGRLNDEESRVGILLPNVAATPITILALWSQGRTPAILNFSTGINTLQSCVELAGLRTIVTSKAFLETAKLDLSSLSESGIRLIYLEEVRESVSAWDRLANLFAIVATPGNAQIAAQPNRPDDVAVVLFTSGSEGMPKGVELTHHNILANIRQLLTATDLIDHDRVFNALPLFHSFGLSIGTMLPLVRGLYVFLYPSPLHYRVVPTLVYGTNATLFLATNTFLNGYARKAHPYDFRTVRYLFAGAEKLQESTGLHWARRFGIRILEGYGATETGPAISVNTPMEPRWGSVGKALPGLETKLVPVDGVDSGGRLHVRGPNVMKGYLNPEPNKAFRALDGWYDTGDIVEIDDEGFLFVKGRLKRFAKISGEMVSLTRVEDALSGAFPQFGLRCQVAILTRPDEDKGEALIAVTNESKLTIKDIRTVIRDKGLSNLFAPREIVHVREIPLLGTGKINHRELQKRIDETSAGNSPAEDGDSGE